MPVMSRYRVVCDECDLERSIASRVLAEDIVDGHEADQGCDGAEWEVVEGD